MSEGYFQKDLTEQEISALTGHDHCVHRGPRLNKESTGRQQAVGSSHIALLPDDKMPPVSPAMFSAPCWTIPWNY